MSIFGGQGVMFHSLTIVFMIPYHLSSQRLKLLQLKIYSSRSPLSKASPFRAQGRPVVRQIPHVSAYLLVLGWRWAWNILRPFPQLGQNWPSSPLPPILRKCLIRYRRHCYRLSVIVNCTKPVPLSPHSHFNLLFLKWSGGGQFIVEEQLWQA